MWPLSWLVRGGPRRGSSTDAATYRRVRGKVGPPGRRPRRTLGRRRSAATAVAERSPRRPSAGGGPASVRASQPAPEPERIVRFDRHQRLQHVLMLSAFTVCAVSGLPQKFPDVGASRWWVELLGGIENVRDIHHWAAYLMLADCVYHVLYLVFRVGVQRRLDVLRMIPTPKDIDDAANMFLYYLGARAEKPKFDRFTYLEKFDYWAVFWGIAVIGGSGLILLFPVTATGILPGHILPTAHAVHSDEAMLAVGWIVIAHIFYVHLSPRVFPFNTSIFTGRLRGEHYEEEHPLEYQRLVERRRAALQTAAAGAKGVPAPEGRTVHLDTS